MNRTKKGMTLLLGLALLAGVQGVTAVARAQDEEAKKASASSDTELAKQMEVIDEGLKKLRRTLRKPDNNKDSLEIINQVQAAAASGRAKAFSLKRFMCGGSS